MSRPTVTAYNCDTGLASGNPIPLPAVFRAPIRSDVVHQVFSLMNKNRRQAHGVYEDAGHQTSAESWGTGRAVARIPRVAGGGTHRAGQGAFGNMCRGGTQFAPNKTWRRWQRRVNINLKRYAVSSAVAATAVLGLVQARGHRVSHLPEIPLVVSADSFGTISKTKQAVAALKKLGAYGDVKRVIASKKLRAGRGKMRNRRHTQRLGPLIVFKESKSLPRAFRNIPGVELCKVERLNLLKLAPGGHLGRFVIWTSDAFAALDGLFSAQSKHGFQMPLAKLANASLTRIMRSEEVLSKLRRRCRTRLPVRRRNPLVNFGTLLKLNPYVAVTRRADVLRQKAFENARAHARKLLKNPAVKTAKKTKYEESSKKRRVDPAVKARKDKIKAEWARRKAEKAAKAPKKDAKKPAVAKPKQAPKKEVVPGKKPLKRHSLRGLLNSAGRKAKAARRATKKHYAARKLFTQQLIS